ncbi:MAG: NAD(P)/FAD-dependent oxidoreductase [Puniceicoccaceae bacterium]
MDGDTVAPACMDVAIIGGGAAGYFVSANLALRSTGSTAVLFEASSRPLSKVRISGGGRCNVTHHQFDPLRLVENYPRGSRELRGSFTRFHPEHMISWLANRGVKTKTEADGRVFPVSDDSGEIIRTLMEACRESGVETRTGYRLQSVERMGSNCGFRLGFQNGYHCECRYLVMGTGSHASGHRIAAQLGHTVVSPVPSLFTFNIQDARIEGLAGVSFSKVRARYRAGKGITEQQGPMLITHWGLSGPAILKLSAWAARELAAQHYRGEIEVDFLADCSVAEAEQRLLDLRDMHGAKMLRNAPFDGVPRRYWTRMLEVLGLQAMQVSQLNKSQWRSVLDQLKCARFAFDGKSTNKDEFVTAGGISTGEVDLKTMQSRRVSGLYFLGEMLNVDGVTGGFNFQFAWTSAMLCARNLNERIVSCSGDAGVEAAH